MLVTGITAKSSVHISHDELLATERFSPNNPASKLKQKETRYGLELRMVLNSRVYG